MQTLCTQSISCIRFKIISKNIVSLRYVWVCENCFMQSSKFNFNFCCVCQFCLICCLANSSHSRCCRRSRNPFVWHVSVFIHLPVSALLSLSMNYSLYVSIRYANCISTGRVMCQNGCIAIDLYGETAATMCICVFFVCMVLEMWSPIVRLFVLYALTLLIVVSVVIFIWLDLPSSFYLFVCVAFFTERERGRETQQQQQQNERMKKKICTS